MELQREIPEAGMSWSRASMPWLLWEQGRSSKGSAWAAAAANAAPAWAQPQPLPGAASASTCSEFGLMT